jgi:hypothetical protein
VAYHFYVVDLDVARQVFDRRLWVVGPHSVYIQHDAIRDREGGALLQLPVVPNTQELGEVFAPHLSNDDWHLSVGVSMGALLGPCIANIDVQSPNLANH